MSVREVTLPTVILPVYNGSHVLPACLASLQRTLPDAAEVIVVDDASPDPSVRGIIQDFVDGARFTVRCVRHPRNLGFVATVNEAMALTRGDVVLLNSDTIVTPGWIQSLARCGASDAAVATATPWSNNAEICSWPELCRAAPVPADVDAIARAVCAAAGEDYPDLPTGVGFCLWIARAALDAVGDFDAATYGRGYGEENDFCQRAAAHGWRNVLCVDAYVAHVGHASFQGENLSPGGVNLARLQARYPRYEGDVAAFIAADPLAALRERIHSALQQDGRADLRSAAA